MLKQLNAAALGSLPNNNAVAIADELPPQRHPPRHIIILGNPQLP